MFSLKTSSYLSKTVIFNCPQTILCNSASILHSVAFNVFFLQVALHLGLQFRFQLNLTVHHSSV